MQVLAEWRVHSRLTHEFIVPLYGAVEDRGYVTFLMEAQQGDLLWYLDEQVWVGVGAWVLGAWVSGAWVRGWLVHAGARGRHGQASRAWAAELMQLSHSDVGYSLFIIVGSMMQSVQYIHCRKSHTGRHAGFRGHG